MKKGKTKMDLAEQLREDIRDFKKDQRRESSHHHVVRFDRVLH